MKTELFLARRYLFRGKARHISFIGIISCLGLILGVAALIIAFAIVNGVDGGLLKRIMEFQDHVTVESLSRDNLVAVKERVSEWEEVDAAYLWLQTQVFAKFDESIIPLVVKGIDLSDKGVDDLFYKYVQDDFGGSGFFVGDGLRKRFLVKDKIDFYPLEKKLRLKEQRVRGFFKVDLFEIDNYYLIADLDDAIALSPNYALFLGIRIKDPFHADIVRDKIINTFGKGIYVNSWIDTNKAIFTTLKLEKLAMFIILSLIVIIASFNIFAILTIKVVEKTKDIGILRAIGFTRRKILSVFTLQGFILGFIGVAVGSLLGLGTCAFLMKYPLIRVPAEIFGSEYLPLVVDYSDVLIIAVSGIAIAFLSSLAPAIRASRLIPAESLRYE